MEIPVGYGEVVDKVTILRIKVRKISDAARRAHAARELELLEARWGGSGLPWPPQVAELEQVNEALWDIEDEIRRLDAASDFGDRFVTLARAVYRTNDRRAALKRAVNDQLGSEIVEVKEYVAY